MRHDFVTVCLMVGLTIAGLSVEPWASAQTMGERLSQNNQIGINSFVSSKGAEFALFDCSLYHNTGEVGGDVWDRVAGQVKLIALDPNNENILYTVGGCPPKRSDNDNKIMKSLNGGKEWITLNAPVTGLPILCLAVNPANSQEIFVGTASGLIKSMDAGFSWRTSSFSLPVNQFFVKPNSPSNHYLLSAGRIFVSSDSGNTWKISDTGLPLTLVRGTGRTASKVPALTHLLLFVPWDKPFLLASTEKGLFRSDDDGASWHSAGAGLDTLEPFITAALERNRITLAALSALYTSTDGLNWGKVIVQSGRNTPTGYRGAISHAQGGGLLLQFRFTQDPPDKVRIGYLHPNGALVGLNYGVLPHFGVENVCTGQIGGRPAILVITTANGSYRDVNDLECQFVSSANPRISFAYNGPQFLFGSTDGGNVWELLGKMGCGTYLAAPRGAATEIWEYGGPKCIASTQDGGVSWAQMPGFNPGYSNSTIRALILDSQNHNIAYYTAGVNEAHVFRYQYDPSTKQGQSTDLNVVADQVLADELNPASLFAGSNLARTAQLSTDGGWTWKDKLSVLSMFLGKEPFAATSRTFTLTSFRNREIAAIVSEHDRMREDGSGNIRVIRSRDQGDTWDEIARFHGHIPVQDYNEWRPSVFINNNDTSNYFVTTTAAPGGSGTGNPAIKVLETKDGGRTWHEIYSHPVTVYDGRADRIVRAVSQMPNGTGRTLVLSGSDGVWKCDDGQTWKRLGGIQ